MGKRFKKINYMIDIDSFVNHGGMKDKKEIHNRNFLKFRIGISCFKAL